MNPLALDLNEQLSNAKPEIADMLSDLGKLMYYPKGILSQSAEAKSTQYNATIGMATYKNSKMYADTLNGFSPLISMYIAIVSNIFTISFFVNMSIPP